MVIIEKDISKIATKISNSSEAVSGTIESIQEQLKQFCKEQNIKIIHIPYWDYDKISIEYIRNRIIL